MARLSIMMGALIVSFSALCGCFGQRAQESLQKKALSLPPTPVFRIKVYWIVIEDFYTRIESHPFGEEKKPSSVGILRRGDVVPVLKMASSSKNQSWYKVSVDGRQGWIPVSAATRYKAKAQAETAARRALSLDGIAPR